MIANLYKLQYSMLEVEPALVSIINYINTPLDVTNPTELLTKREQGRLLLTVSSKCYLTVDYALKRQASRTGEEYALYSSLKEYCKMVREDLEATLLSIANTLNYYRQER